MNETPQSRITWRHDSVLFAIFRAVLAVVNRYKKTQAEGRLCCTAASSSAIPFTSESNTFKAPRAPEVKELLVTASDWRLQFDIDAPSHCQVKDPPFPMEIAVTTLRPDGLMWSSSTKQVIWIELTSPWEENMDKWNLTKRANYNGLKVECEQKGWKVFPLCVEVGCRGHVSDKSFPYMCRVLGFSKRERKDLKWALERTALYCSYAIFVHRFHAEWGKKPLLDVSGWH